MGKRRLAYGLLLASVLTLYLFVNNTGTRILLVLCFGLPPLSSLTLLIPRGPISAALSLPETARRDESVSGTLTLASDRRVSGSLTAQLRLENRLTGEITAVSRVLKLRRGICDESFSIHAAHCGVLALSVTDLRVYDPLGLFVRVVPVTAAAETAILPESRPLTLTLAEAADSPENSPRYADRPGFDPSETFRIRDYVPGDPVRQIHWKLSEKADKTLVRDFGLPVVQQLLLLVELSGSEPSDRDAALDLLASAAEALLLKELPFTLGWQYGGDWVLRDISDPNAFQEALRALLCVSIHPDERPVFADCEPARAFAHVAVIACAPPLGLERFRSGCRVTLLMPSSRAEALPAWENEVALLPFTDQTDQIEL